LKAGKALQRGATKMLHNLLLCFLSFWIQGVAERALMWQVEKMWQALEAKLEILNSKQIGRENNLQDKILNLKNKFDELVKSQSARHCEESASGGRRGNLMILSAFLKTRLLPWRSQ
jgi:hypothetical protein